MSRILPRTGAYFIRRSFQDDPVYKEALGGFINSLVQRRFHQEFFIEGGRTRSGKQLPPRYGMLRYVVDSCRRSGVTDVLFVPTAITYDQLLEVDEYARHYLLHSFQKEKYRENLLNLHWKQISVQLYVLANLKLYDFLPILKLHKKENSNCILVL